jgi:cysteinyl-tRNA synthetase
MPLRLYNTLTRQKEDFAPIDRANVRLYACGPTVYDHLHIGNGRMLIVFDVLFRLLRREYGENNVTYVRNITDVDDKINARAAERGVDIRVLTEEMTKVFHEDAKALGCLPPTVEPRATDHIAEMIALIEKLIAKSHAYVAEEHVLFDVPSMPAYGKLSKRPLDEMIAGARVEVAPYKRGPMDFVLWKPSSASEAGWESPWGRGRPGWHIECSAMSWKHLGEVFDIHGGGIDLLFPHHENEMAQSCSAFGHDLMAKVWMHNGHLQVEGEKMAKSLGNFVTIRELLNSWKGRPWSGSAIRLAMIGTNYRQPIDWTLQRLGQARAELGSYASICVKKNFSDPNTYDAAWSAEPSQLLLSALADNLNTPDCCEVLRSNIKRRDHTDQSRAQLIADLQFLGLATRNKIGAFSPSGGISGSDIPADVATESLGSLLSYMTHYANGNSLAQGNILKRMDDIGVSFHRHEDGYVEGKYHGQPDDRVRQLISARNAARAAKNWAEADRIRDELAKKNITLQDHEDGTTTAHVTAAGQATGEATVKGIAPLEVKR